LTSDIAIITVDTFSKWDNGIHCTVGSGQLAWAEQKIVDFKAQGVKHIFFQGHVPCVVPVRTYASSNLQMEGHDQSEFWKMLKRHDDVVDLYLNGEVHDMTCYTDGGLTQVSHGSLVTHGHENYLVVDVWDDRIELTLKAFFGTVTDSNNRLWGLSLNKRGPAGIQFNTPPIVVGTMTIANTTKTRSNRMGYLTEGLAFTPPPEWVYPDVLSTFAIDGRQD
jgi:hypothetical protein